VEKAEKKERSDRDLLPAKAERKWWGDMDFQQTKRKLIKKYGMKIFIDLDNTIIKKEYVKYYRDNYSMSYHLCTLAQLVSGEKRLVDIDEELQENLSINVPDKYFSGYMGSKFRRIFGKDIIPKPLLKNRINRKEKKKTRKKTGNSVLYKSQCLKCLKKYEVDIKKHPANLCGCLKCYPNGIGFQKTTTRQDKPLSRFN
jgi:hypothetical protein